MSKRLNPYRRTLKRLRECELHAHDLTVAYNTEPVQQGPVRSSLVPKRHLISYKVPRDGLWEGSGKAGKSVKGKLKPLAKPSRFNAPSRQHEVGSGKVEVQTSPDTLRLEALRRFKNGRPIRED